MSDDFSFRSSDDGYLDLNDVRERTRESRRRTASAVRSSVVERTRTYTPWRWESELIDRIHTPGVTITKLEVEDAYRQNIGRRDGQTEFQHLDCARKWADSFMVRQDLVIRKQSYACKKSARNLFHQVELNWREYDEISEAISQQYRVDLGKPENAGCKLYITNCNCDETFIRDHYQSSAVLVPRGSLPSRTHQANLKTGYAGSTLLVYVSSEVGFIPPPTLICHRHRPNRHVKAKALTSFNNVFPGGLLWVGGNTKGIHRMDAGLWQEEITKVKNQWIQYRARRKEQGFLEYLIWMCDSASCHDVGGRAGELREHGIWIVVLRRSSTFWSQPCDASGVFRTLKATLKTGGVRMEQGSSTILMSPDWVISLRPFWDYLKHVTEQYSIIDVWHKLGLTVAQYQKRRTNSVDWTTHLSAIRSLREEAAAEDEYMQGRDDDDNIQGGVEIVVSRDELDEGGDDDIIEYDAGNIRRTARQQIIDSQR